MRYASKFTYVFWYAAFVLLCILVTDVSAGDRPRPHKVGIAALREAAGQTEGETRVTTYALTVGDGGGGTWQWTTDTTSTDDVGTIIVPNCTPRTGCWKRLRGRRPSQNWKNFLWRTVSRGTPKPLYHALFLLLLTLNAVPRPGHCF